MAAAAQDDVVWLGEMRKMKIIKWLLRK